MIDKELQRQSMLREMGFATWVAQRPLPAAIASPVLGEKPQKQKPAPAAAPKATAQAAAAPAPTQDNTASLDVLAQVKQSLAGADTSKATAKQSPAPTAETKPEDLGTPYQFTLQALPMPFGILLVEQKDHTAPGFDRNEQALLKNFLALWGSDMSRQKRFTCPISHEAMYEEDARGALSAFVRALVRRCAPESNKVLLLASETTSQLLVKERYELAQNTLAVSSLAEMLEDPKQHKKTSWQAIMSHAYYAAAEH